MNIAIPSRSNIVTMPNTKEDSLLERTVTSKPKPKPTSSSSSSDDQLLSSCVNVQSKTEYYDNDRILSKWGFSDNICHCCEKKNSDLHGLLMQCAKCKKAYYCSMKCFNDHLPEHQKFCTTKEIYSEPKGKASPFEFAREKETIIETFTDSDTKIIFDTEPDDEPSDHERIKNVIVKSKRQNKRNQDGVDDDDDEYEEVEVSEYDLDDDSIVEFVVEEQNINNVMDLQSSMKSFTLPTDDDNAPRSFHQSYNDFGEQSNEKGIRLRPYHNTLPEGSDSWKMEEVDLRHTEQIKNHYSWSTPDWVSDRKLRATSRGNIIKNGTGDLISPVTNAKVLIDQGIITWQVPDWTNAKLRKTPRGEQIKRAAAHASSEND